MITEQHLAAATMAGEAVAHAAWSISDVAEGELLCVLAMVDRAAPPRELYRFEADTQETAISDAKAEMAIVRGQTDVRSYGMVREGVLVVGPSRNDALTFDAWATGLSGPISGWHRFTPAWSPTGFTVLGDPGFAIDGKAVAGDELARLCTAFREGVSRHLKAGALWLTWQRP